MTTTLEELITPMTVDEAKTAIYDALAAATSKALPPGNVIRRALTEPAADVAVGTYEAPVVGTITPTAIHFVERQGVG